VLRQPELVILYDSSFALMRLKANCFISTSKTPATIPNFEIQDVGHHQIRSPYHSQTFKLFAIDIDA
jgi:hypothetical protein